MMHAASTESSPQKISRNILVIGVIILVAIASATVIIVRQVKDSKATDNTIVSSKIIGRVSSLYIVPTNETPTVAQIKDKSSLEKDQAFYQGAENGDYLLIYTKAKIALIYRESVDKLVKVAPVAEPIDPRTNR